jgi:LPXTG-motif cell wall-anchored protein
VSAARRSSSTARRTLLTATAAGTLLTALWFVPSANATQDATEQRQLTTMTTDATTETSTDAVTTSGSAGSTSSAGPHTQLADTGSPNTTPYLVGGTLFLGLGAGFVAYSVRRERTAPS